MESMRERRMEMDGMSSMGTGMGRTYNQELARAYWYLIAAFLALVLARRGAGWYLGRKRLQRSKARLLEHPTQPSNALEAAFATVTALAREISYPQLHFNNRWISWLSPPPVGRSVLLLCYGAVLTFMLTNRAIVEDAYYHERVGFRAAWISVTQIPLVYLLSSKSSLVGVVVGSSHERLNWLHRWVSRSLLLTVTVHGGFFFREWWIADFIQKELDMMSMVKYGIGGWFILLWTFLSSLSPLRSWAYEVFVVQHIAAAVVFLCIIYIHVPSYARYNVWIAIAVMSFDWVSRACLLLSRNLKSGTTRAAWYAHETQQPVNSTTQAQNIWSAAGPTPAKFIGSVRTFFKAVSVEADFDEAHKLGYQIQLQDFSDDITIVTIKNVHFAWSAGQHVYLWIPRLGRLESHPFTIAIPYAISDGNAGHDIQLIVQKKKGFTRRLHQYASRSQYQNVTANLTGFVTGPYGVLPNWSTYETLLLISASTGASFTLPVLESILQSSSTTCIKRIAFLLIVRHLVHVDIYASRLTAALSRAEALGINLSIEIAITEEEYTEADTNGICLEERHVGPSVSDKTSPQRGVYKTLTTLSDEKFLEVAPSRDSGSGSRQLKRPPLVFASRCDSSDYQASHDSVNPFAAHASLTKTIVYSSGRPNIEACMRKMVEMTGGETGVAVCGGKSLVSRVRNGVAALSNDRGVHKGTGANGIFLHVEEFCF